LEPTSSLPNLEALLNIIANSVEILGIATAGTALTLGWTPMACGAKGYDFCCQFYGCRHL